jgi:hypoxanthine phosphoribosyltransferase
MAKAPNDTKRSAKTVISIPDDVVLSPQAEPPRGPLGQDRSGRRSMTTELSWAEFDRRAQSLARKVAKDWAPDAVVGVAHGGVFVGGALAKGLGCEFYPVRISRRSRDHKPTASPKLFGEMPKELKGQKVLVVDDVASSGDTLELAVAKAKKVGAREVRTCTLIARPDGFAPDWTALETDAFWVFPWDYDISMFDRFQGVASDATGPKRAKKPAAGGTRKPPGRTTLAAKLKAKARAGRKPKAR